MQPTHPLQSSSRPESSVERQLAKIRVLASGYSIQDSKTTEASHLEVALVNKRSMESVNNSLYFKVQRKQAEKRPIVARGSIAE